MTAPAHLNLFAQAHRRRASLKLVRLRVAQPGNARALIETRQKPLGVVFLGEGRPVLGPRHMTRAPPVTCLAADADLFPGGGEAVCGGIVILGDAGGVTLGAHEVPILVQLGPVQRVVVANVLVGIEMEPALAALLFRAAVPRNRQRLNAAVRKLDEILLQRLQPESVFHFEGLELAVGAVGLDEELAVLAEEAGLHAEIVELRVIEVAEDRLFIGMRHGVGML